MHVRDASFSGVGVLAVLGGLGRECQFRKFAECSARPVHDDGGGFGSSLWFFRDFDSIHPG